MNTLLRRSAAPALRRTLAAMLGYEIPIFASLESPVSGYFSNIGDLGQRLGFRRDFHFSSVPREFRFSAVTRAEYAVDDSPFWEDERSKGATDEGLEIAKLGISREIVSSLAHKGITRLFPIQVCSCFGYLCLTYLIYLKYFSFFAIWTLLISKLRVGSWDYVVIIVDLWSFSQFRRSYYSRLLTIYQWRYCFLTIYHKQKNFRYWSLPINLNWFLFSFLDCMLGVEMT